MSEPHNNDAVQTDPNDAANQGNWIVVRISLAQWVWDGNVLDVSKWHHKNVPDDVFDA